MLWLKLIELAGLTGLEPATSYVTGRRSNQLSYNPAGRDAVGSNRGGKSRGRIAAAERGCQ